METIIREPVLVQWVELEEGLDGEYVAENPEDIELLRFDVYTRSGDGSWEGVEAGSHCTQMPVKAPEVIRTVALSHLLEEIYAEVKKRGYAKRRCEAMAMLAPDSLAVIRGTLEKIGPAGLPGMLRQLREIHPLHGVRFAANWIHALRAEEAALLTEEDVRPLLEAKGSARELATEAVLTKRPDLLSQQDLQVLLASSSSSLRSFAIAALHRVGTLPESSLQKPALSRSNSR